jgi:hypothetical protein
MKTLLLFLLLTIVEYGFSQPFANNDSNKIHLALIQKFNQRNQLLTETYKNYQRNSGEGNTDGTYYYYYQDTLLTKVIYIDYHLDTSKRLIFYDTNNKLIKEERYKCKKRLRKDVDKGFGRPGGCVVFEEDFENFRTWAKENEIHFMYDKLGRIIERNDLNDYDKKWKYNNQNQIEQEIGFDNGKLKYKEEYIYFEGGYKNTRIYYEENGLPEKPEYANGIFSPIYTSTYYTNVNGQVYKEVVTTEKNELISTELFFYNKEKQIIRSDFINGKGEKEITHRYDYK